MAFDKVRVRFRKSDDLRLVSHLDLVRAFERLLRRGQIPIRMTEGFHPGPRMIFAQSLSLGVIGLREVLELELTEFLEPDDLLNRLRTQAPPGIMFGECRRIPLKTTARPRRAFYRFAADTPESAETAARRWRTGEECWVERMRPRPRAIDVRPYVESARADGSDVHVSAWLTVDGTVRTDELTRLMNLPTGTVVERTDLELHDEIDPAESARTPNIAPRIRPWKPETTVTVTAPRDVWGVTADGPLTE